jgi:cytochrome P450
MMAVAIRSYIRATPIRMSNTISEIPRQLSYESTTVTTRELEEHPHRVFRHYRPITPFVGREDGAYIALRAADVEQLATDPRTRQFEVEYLISRGVSEGPLLNFARHTLMLSNGTAHRRRRAALSRAFAGKLIAELRPRIRAIAEDLIDECVREGGMNLVADYCALIPVRVIAMILGLPAADMVEFARHVYSLARVFTPTFSREMVPQMQNSALELMWYMEEFLGDCNQHRRNGVMLPYFQGTDSPSPGEAVSQLVTAIISGSDPVRTAMAIQVSLLLQHPQQWQAVCRNRAHIPGAVLESLRYEPAIGSVARLTSEDLAIDGWVVPRNCILQLSTLSALRDPAICCDPDDFNITRADAPRRHPVFGAGAHRCLGEALGKAELEEGLAALTARLPSLQLAGQPPAICGSDGIRSIRDMRVSRSGDSWHASCVGQEW